MRCLPNKDISEDKLNYLKENFFDFGSESTITKDSSKKSVYKIFKEGNMDYIDFMYMTENKLSKLKKLYNIRGFNNDIRILNTVSCNGDLVGYQMTYNPNDVNMVDIKLSTKEKIKYLRQVKEKLKYFEAKDIIYHDVKAENILINTKTGKINFCDLDNICIGKFGADLVPTVLQEYYETFKTIKPNVHSYIHNIFTINEIEGRMLCLDDALSILKDGIRPMFLNENASKITDEIVDLNKSYSDKYIIDEFSKVKVR